jgi:REP element-mobilizing transposase RayT
MRKRLFITWVTHNSRYNEKMKMLKLENQEWYFLNDEDRVIIYNLICGKLEQDWIKDFTLNVLTDHVHIVLMYEESNLSELIQKIKWGVSYEYTKIKKIVNKWEWRKNKIWARWFSKTYLDTEEHFEKAVKYTLDNHKKHEILDIYQLVNRRL